MATWENELIRSYFWYDTTNDVLKKYDATSGTWVGTSGETDAKIAALEARLAALEGA